MKGDRMNKKTIDSTKAIELLPDGLWVHVFTPEGHREGEQWSRARVSEHIQKNGAELAGEEAMKHQHGLVSGGVFIQTRNQPKEKDDNAGL